eukprot:gene3383-4205_t
MSELCPVTVPPSLSHILGVCGITLELYRGEDDQVFAQAPAPPKPTLANVAYGKHERQALDFYQAEVEGAAPLLFFVHGGGWMNGDKADVDFLAQCLKTGISVVSINYRLIPDAIAEKVNPPVKACLDDAAR